MEKTRTNKNQSEINAVLITFLGVFLAFALLAFHIWLLSDAIESFIGIAFYSHIPLDDRKLLDAPAFASPIVCMFLIVVEVVIIRIGLGKMKIRITWE